MNNQFSHSLPFSSAGRGHPAERRHCPKGPCGCATGKARGAGRGEGAPPHPQPQPRPEQVSHRDHLAHGSGVKTGQEALGNGGGAGRAPLRAQPRVRVTLSTRRHRSEIACEGTPGLCSSAAEAQWWHCGHCRPSPVPVSHRGRWRVGPDTAGLSLGEGAAELRQPPRGRWRRLHLLAI